MVLDKIALNNGLPSWTRWLLSEVLLVFFLQIACKYIYSQAAFPNVPQFGQTWPNLGPTGAHMECCLGSLDCAWRVEVYCLSLWREAYTEYAGWAVTAGIPVKFGTTHGRSRPEVGGAKCIDVYGSVGVSPPSLALWNSEQNIIAILTF